MTENLVLVSIVIPCLNSAGRLPIALASLAMQDYPSHLMEVIIADGGSTDGTREIAFGAGAKVINNPGRTVAPGRNAGFAASKGAIIGFTDDDCTFTPDWVSNAIRCLSESNAGGIGGPTWIPEDETPFGKAVAELYAMANVLAGSAHRETVESARQVDELPGCNCFFHRSALIQVMPTDETLVTGDDVELCLRVRQAGYHLLLVPDIPLWHNKRPTPRGVFRQMYRYAIGRLQVGRLHRPLLRPMHILVGLFVPISILGILAFMLWWPKALPMLFMLLVSILLIIGVVASIRRSAAPVIFWLPIVLLIMPTAWSLGFMREFLFPHRSKS